MHWQPSRETTRPQARPGLDAARRAGSVLAVAVAALALLGPGAAASAAVPAAASVTIASNLPSRQPVGTTITWTTRASGMTDPVYRFSVGPAQGSSSIVRDFSRTSSFSWTPLHEGTYAVRASAKDGFAATSTTDIVATFVVVSRVTGNTAVVSAMPNPLIALYSAPACAKGTVTVQFRATTGVTWQSAAAQPCVAGQSVNVIVAGMRPRTRYILQHVVANGSQRTTSPQLTFTTGAPPAGLKIATFAVKKAATLQSDHGSSLIFHALNVNPSPTLANPIATDLNGQLLWYYDTLHSGLTMIWPLHILPGGTILLFGRDRYRTTGDDVLREIDLAGDTVRETNIDAVNVQLAHRGQQSIYAFHHDAIRLPNGDTAVLGETEKLMGRQNVMSDMIVVLDANFQVVWTWDMFSHLSPGSTFPPGQICKITYPLTLCAVPNQQAEDWTHANGLGWSPEDNDLTLSIRHLDWVIKIDYNNGHGSGNVVWRLGKGGDFTIKSSNPSPWFSHQHNAYLIDPTTMVLFDNGNARCLRPGVKSCDSRGEELKLDVQHHTVTPVLIADMGAFRQALGSGQKLANGNLFFAGGFPASHEIEFRPDGTAVYELDSPLPEYRDYRLAALSF